MVRGVYLIGTPKPLRWLYSRLATIEVSTVTTSASQLTARARSISERMCSRSVNTYSWNHSRPPPCSATRSIGVTDAVDSVYGMPAAAAARAASTSPSYHSMPPTAVGEIAIGIAAGLSKMTLSSLRFLTSTSTRGCSRMRASASRLLASARSSSEPRSTYSNRPRGSRLRASKRRSAMLKASVIPAPS